MILRGNDRYLIYKLLGRFVDVKLPVRLGGDRFSGIVEEVYRDIFEKQVSITIEGVTHNFREPSAIVPGSSASADVCFLYGDVEPAEVDDDFNVPHYNGYDESLHEHLKRTERCPVSKVIFKVGDLKKTPKSRWSRSKNRKKSKSKSDKVLVS